MLKMFKFKVMNKYNRLHLAVCVVCLLFMACIATQSETMDEEIGELKNTNWELIRPKDLEGSIQFGDNLNKIEGFNGCNNFSADITIKNYQIEIGRFTSTELYCDKKDILEREFMYRLSQVNDYTRINKRLMLNNHRENLLVFELNE